MQLVVWQELSLDQVLSSSLGLHQFGHALAKHDRTVVPYPRSFLHLDLSHLFYELMKLLLDVPALIDSLLLFLKHFFLEFFHVQIQFLEGTCCGLLVGVEVRNNVLVAIS